MSLLKILVPTDGSEYTKDALDAAVEVAKLSGGAITALFVVDRSSVSWAPVGDDYNNITEMLNKQGERALNHIKEECDAAGVDVSTLMLGGDPASLIIEQSPNFDLVVMSTAGSGGSIKKKLLIGSVADKVVKSASCKVMTIRHNSA